MDGANPDSGVNKEFVVGESLALTHVSDAEVNPFYGLFRAINPLLLPWEYRSNPVPLPD